MITTLFGAASALCILIGALPYIKDIIDKKVHPHLLSWLGWGLITALGASAMFAEGSTWVSVIVFANTVACLSIVVVAMIKKVGVWKASSMDPFLFLMGLVGLILWQTLHMPVLALICALIADLSFGLPTVFKTYKDPSSETPFVWIMATISGVLSMFAIQTIAFHEVAYPVYLLLFDATVLLIVFKIIKKKQAL